MLNCVWCNTTKGSPYQDVPEFLGKGELLCKRCFMIIKYGVCINGRSDFPDVPDDADPTTIEWQTKARAPLPQSVYFEWVTQQGNQFDNAKDFLQFIAIGRRIKAVVGADDSYHIVSPTTGVKLYIDFDLLVECAERYPPTLLPVDEFPMKGLESYGINPYYVIHALAKQMFYQKEDEASPEHIESSTVCGGCGKEGEFKKACPRCGEIFYCSHKCQKIHWKVIC